MTLFHSLVFFPQVHNGLPHPSNYGYSFAKRMVDVLNHCYNKQHGKIFTSVVPSNGYGPQDNFNIETGHAVPGKGLEIHS